MRERAAAAAEAKQLGNSDLLPIKCLGSFFPAASCMFVFHPTESERLEAACQQAPTCLLVSMCHRSRSVFSISISQFFTLQSSCTTLLRQRHCDPFRRSICFSTAVFWALRAEGVNACIQAIVCELSVADVALLHPLHIQQLLSHFEHAGSVAGAAADLRLRLSWAADDPQRDGRAVPHRVREIPSIVTAYYAKMR